MESSQSLPERIALAQDTAKAIEARIVELHGAKDGPSTKSLRDRGACVGCFGRQEYVSRFVKLGVCC